VPKKLTRSFLLGSALTLSALGISGCDQVPEASIHDKNVKSPGADSAPQQLKTSTLKNGCYEIELKRTDSSRISIPRQIICPPFKIKQPK
jgi:hypothetical protein